MQLLATKLHAPPEPPHLVPRQRLLAQVDEAVSRHLTLISAPAGVGKTTLLSEWRISAAGQHWPLTWLSLDESDSDQARFLMYLVAIEADMGDMPDEAPTLAIVAAFAEGTTVISNVAHLRIKECDRVSAVVTELRKMGAEVEEEPDRMLIHGRAGGANLHGATIETYHDHRIAMCFAVAGLRVPGVEITGEACVAKSFPHFWERFALLARSDRQ